MVVQYFIGMHKIGDPIKPDAIIGKGTTWKQLVDELAEPIAIFSYTPKYAPQDTRLLYTEWQGGDNPKIVLRGATSIIFNSIKWNLSVDLFQDLYPYGNVFELSSYQPSRILLTIGNMASLELLPLFVVIEKAWLNDFPQTSMGKNSESVIELEFAESPFLTNFDITAFSVDAFGSAWR